MVRVVLVSSLGTRDRTQGNGRKLQLVMLRLDMRTRFFISHQEILLREAVPKLRVKGLDDIVFVVYF